MKDIKWACAQPLIGGMAIATYQLLQTPPEFIITGFAANDEEFINYCNNVLKLNVPVLTMDPEYKHFTTEEDRELFNQLNKNIDIMNYVPICSGLSQLTTNCSTCKVENTQNENQYNLTNFILKEIRPKVAVYENAPGLYTDSGKDVLEIIKTIARDHDYSLTVEKTDTYKHGIPQHRHRTFAYFFDEEYSSYINYENIQPKPIIEYLKEIPKYAKAQDLFAGEPDAHRDVSYEFIESLGNNESVQEVVKRYNPDLKFITGYQFIHFYTGFDKVIEWLEKRLEDHPTKRYEGALKNFKRMKDKVQDDGRYWDDSCFISIDPISVNAVIWKTMKQQKHPTEDRPINIREYAHLMGMPHDFNLLDWNNWVRLSQSVPVSTSRHVMKQCIDYVNGDLHKSSSTFIKQNNVKKTVDFVESEILELDEW